MQPDTDLQSDYHFILKCFNPDEIEQIISDMELHKQGYHFLYCLDTYDIMENYMPYYKKELFSKTDNNVQAQKFICYDYFFNEINKTNCILLDEYKIELFAAKNKLNKDLRELKVLMGNFGDLKSKTDDFLHDKKATTDFFKKNFEVILLLLILSDKSHNILNDFFNFINKRLNISEINIEDKTTKQKIEDIFGISEPTPTSIKIFQEYIHANTNYLLTIENPNDRNIFLENTYRDIQVIDRVTQINGHLTKNDLRYKLIYISSANKTKEIFKVIDGLPFNENKVLVSNKNIPRNIYQYFLFDRLKYEYHSNPEEAIRLLNELKNLLTKLNNASKLFEVEKDENHQKVVQLVKRIFDEKSNILDNHFYYSVYEKYKNTFKDTSGDELLDHDSMLKIMSEIDKNQDIYKSRIFALEYALSQLNQTYDVADNFWGIDNYEPEYRYGKDIVRNPYQHLPTLLLIGEEFDSILKNKLYVFLNINIEVTDSNSPQLKECAKEIFDELYNFNTTSSSSKFLKSLIITYLNFVAQSKSKATQADIESNMEERLIFDLEKQYLIIKHHFLKVDLEQTAYNKSITYFQGHTELLIEVVYILLWLYRRNLNEDEGIKIAVDLIKPGFSDPRIYQGIGLCYLSKVYRAMKSEIEADEMELKSDTDLALQYLRLAEKHYKDLMNLNPEKETGCLIIKNYIAVLNSIADMNVRKYEFMKLKPDESLIESGRKCINEIKVLFDTIDLIYDMHPTYSATEVEIEYYEALHFYEQGMTSSAHAKIINASTRLNMIKKIHNTRKIIDGIFLEKQFLINKLTHKIINHRH